MNDNDETNMDDNDTNNNRSLLQNILIETVDETLQNLSQYRNFYFDKFSNITPQEIQFFLKNKSVFNRIGANSGSGEIYHQDGSNFVIKKVSICPDKKQTNPLVDKLCNISKTSDFVFYIPNTETNKYTLLIPDYVEELIIEEIITKITPFYTPSFSTIINYFYDNKNKIVYSTLEKLDALSNYIYNESGYLYLLFQIIQGIYTGQQLAKYTHYDLHLDNLLARSKRDDEINIYELDDGSFLYTYFNFDAVIIDYGHNRLETDNYVVLPRVLFQIGGDERLGYYEFNPYYDIFTFLRALLFHPNIPYEVVPILTAITSFFLDTPEDELDKLYLDVSIPNTWRPYPEKLYMYNITTPSRLLVFIKNIIKDLIPSFVERSDYTFYDYLEEHRFFVSNTKINIKSIFPDTRINEYNIIPEDKKMDITYYKYHQYIKDDIVSIDDGIVNITYSNNLELYRNTLADFNDAIPLSIRLSRNFDKQGIHIAEINQRLGVSSGYKFKFDCCRIDLRDYFQNSRILSGVAINGSFFNINSDYTPIGLFKTDNYNSDDINKISWVYKKYYGIIGIKNDGLLAIDNLDNLDNYNEYITCGPILIKNNVIAITEEMMRTERYNDPYDQYDPLNGTLIWQCGIPQVGEEGNKSIYKGTEKTKIFNCNAINPGELSHSSNPNPRSCLGIKENGNILFIYIEGRDDFGSGVDMVQLAYVCQMLGCVDAINLDGGRSSRLTWKARNEDIINISSNLRSMNNSKSGNAKAYEVGNVISFVNML